MWHVVLIGVWKIDNVFRNELKDKNMFLNTSINENTSLRCIKNRYFAFFEFVNGKEQNFASLLDNPAPYFL